MRDANNRSKAMRQTKKGFSKHRPIRIRFYVHGDQTEHDLGLFYCEACDAFSRFEHFAEHEPNNLIRYEQSAAAWDRQRKRSMVYVRPANPTSLFAAPALRAKQADAAARRSKTQRAGRFYRWLMKQAKIDDLIGDLARDASRDSGFPAESDDYHRLSTYVTESGLPRGALLAFDEAWKTFGSDQLGRSARSKATRTRRGVNLRIRYDILMRDGARCQLCGATSMDGVRLEVDHKIAVAKGGTDDPSNLWLLCFACNSGKGVRDLPAE